MTRKQRLTSVFIIVLICCTWIDGLPTLSRHHQSAKTSLDYYLDKTGLWQESWQLFAPNVDSINTRISATVILKNKRILVWRSPDWRQMSLSERFLRFREAEFYDSIRNQNNSAIWESFGLYLARIAKEQSKVDVDRIVLNEHFVIIADPIYQTFIPYKFKLPLVGLNTLFDKKF